MLIGYVSDEWHLAIAGADVEIRQLGVPVAVARSTPSGAVLSQVPPGTYEVIVDKPGFGAKRTQVRVSPDMAPERIRLLSDKPYGYAWPRCAPAGSSVEIRFHCAQECTIELWRYGWEPELVAVCGSFGNRPEGANRQILPDTDFTRTGCQWNHNGFAEPVHAERRIVAPQRSGLYFFRLKTADTEISFPLVVSPTEPRARLAVLASDITWTAYNDFGGRSNYISSSTLPREPVVNVRQEPAWFPDAELCDWDHESYAPLSFDRPDVNNRVANDERITDPVAVRGAEHLASGEWRLLGWLEREGFDFDLYGETQFHEGIPLDEYDVLVLSTHPEYWTRQMFSTLQGWVQNGGRLAYLGGNGLNCEVEIDGDTMVVRNERQSSVIRDAGEGPVPTRIEQTLVSEATLLGVRHTWAGFGTGYPYRVIEPDHWVFEGTGLSAGDEFGHANLNGRCAPGGASGHETDKLGPHSPEGTTVLARGANPDGGGADMVEVCFEGGGRVFSVGSICYPTSLPVDDLVGQVTRNVLRRYLVP